MRPARTIRLLRLIIECETPLHCGGGEDEIQDQPVTRDAFGYWRIPGSSLAGALRALGEKEDPELTRRMFGEQEGSESHASFIWCEDGLLLDYDGKPVLEKLLAGEEPKIATGPFVRDHVRIDLESGASEDGGKFDAEIVPAGARFLLEFRCDSWDTEFTEAQLAYFDRLCSQVIAGQLSLGGKTGLGYGLYKVLDYACRDLELSEASGMKAWLALPEFCLPAPDLGKTVQLPEVGRSESAGLDGWLEVPLACAGPILIGGGSPHRPAGTGGEADLLFALTPRLSYEGKTRLLWQAVLPGSSIRGVLRHAVYAILQDLGTAKAEEMLNALFGFVDANEGQCGKLVIADSRLEFAGPGPNYQFEQHVALDRFSGGALDGALFSEEPFWTEGAGAKLRIRACNLEAHEAALFFHALFDLLDGCVAIGSGVNRGNGRLCLRGWRENPAAAAAAIGGNLTWNGKNVFADGLANLKQLAPAWDQALRAVI